MTATPTPLPIDVITRRRLLLVKQVFQQALVQAGARQRPVRRIMAVIGFDLANETALKAVAEALYTVRSPADTFPGVLQQLDTLLPGAGFPPLADRANLLSVRRTRNVAQHQARSPD